MSDKHESNSGSVSWRTPQRDEAGNYIFSEPDDPTTAERPHRKESPYTQSFYDQAKYDGNQFVERLLDTRNGTGLTSTQVNGVLQQIDLYFGGYRGFSPDEPGVKTYRENFQAMEAARDWIYEVIAGAGDALVQKTGKVTLLRKATTPRYKYNPPKK